jgi:hypothetical protein
MTECFKTLATMIVGLSWPIVVLIVVYLLKRNIAELIDAFREKIKDDLVRVGLEGVEFRVQGEQAQNKVAEEVSKMAKERWQEVLHDRVTMWAMSRKISDPIHMGAENYERCLTDLGLSKEIRDILNPK